MIVRRVRVRRFRKLGDQDLACTPGLNVVRGPNDAGKSTLHLAFLAALYPIHPSEAKSYRSWGEAVPHGGRALGRPPVGPEAAGEVTLDFEADGHRYELRKDFESRKTALRVDAGAWQASKDIAAQIGRLLGLESVALFRATAHIGQWELQAVQDQSREIGAHLSRIMTGADSDAARVLRAIEEWLRRQEVGLRGRPAIAPGPLKRDQDRIKRLTDEKQRLEDELRQIEGAAAEREGRLAQIAALGSQVVEDEALLAANRRLLDLDRRWEDLSRRAGELDSRLWRIDAAVRALAAAEQDGALGGVEISDDTFAALQQAAARADVLREQRDAAAQAPASTAASPRARTPRDFSAGALAAMAAFAAVAGAALLATHHTAAGGVLLGAAMAAGLAARTARRHAEEAGRASVREREQHEQTLGALRAQCAEAEEAVRRQLRTLGVAAVDAAAAQRNNRRAAQARLQSARQVLDGLLAGETLCALEEARRSLITELAVLRAERDESDLALRRLDPPAFQRFQLEAQRRRRALEDGKAAVQRLEGRLAGHSPHDALARIEEELAEVSARLARQRRQVAVLRLVHEVLDRAHRATIVPGKARLEELASGYLRRLSNGAYDRIVVDAHTLAPGVWIGPPKDWADVSAREIGSGGVDQCYLALRLALVDLLADGRKPPLFLDDPFLAYDEERQASAMAFLRDLARGRQIFLFTCRTVYDPHADHVVVLGTRAAAPISSATLIDAP